MYILYLNYIIIIVLFVRIISLLLNVKLLNVKLSVELIEKIPDRKLSPAKLCYVCEQYQHLDPNDFINLLQSYNT